MAADSVLKDNFCYDYCTALWHYTALCTYTVLKKNRTRGIKIDPRQIHFWLGYVLGLVPTVSADEKGSHCLSPEKTTKNK